MGYAGTIFIAAILFSLFASLFLVRRRNEARRRRKALEEYIEKYIKSPPNNVYRIDEYRD